MVNYTHESLCRKIVEEAPDAIIFADPDGVIQLWNVGAEAIFGYRSEEALGQTLDIIIPERLRERHWQGYRKVMSSGITRYGQELLAVPAMRRDGASISVEFSMVLLQDSAGQVVGSAAIIRDVTVRWQREKALKQRLASLEGNQHFRDGKGLSVRMTEEGGNQ
jgi:PAS domain S-box-containing protein